MDTVHSAHTEEHGSEVKEVKGNLLRTMLFILGGLIVLVLSLIYVPKLFHHSDNDTASATQTAQTVNLSKLTKETGLGDVEIPESGERKVTRDVLPNGHYQDFYPTCPEKVTFVDPFGNEFPFKGNRFQKGKPDINSGWYIIKGRPGTQVTFQAI